MNEIINKYFLAGDKLMPELHLIEPGFTYSACGPFTKSKERTQNFKEAGDSRYIYQNKLDKPFLQHDMAYRDFKILTILLVSFSQLLIKYCVIKHSILLKILNMMDIKKVLLQWFINLLIKRSLVAVLKMRIFQTKN